MSCIITIDPNIVFVAPGSGQTTGTLSAHGTAVGTHEVKLTVWCGGKTTEAAPSVTRPVDENGVWTLDIQVAGCDCASDMRIVAEAPDGDGRTETVFSKPCNRCPAIEGFVTQRPGGCLDGKWVVQFEVQVTRPSVVRCEWQFEGAAPVFGSVAYPLSTVFAFTPRELPYAGSVIITFSESDAQGLPCMASLSFSIPVAACCPTLGDITVEPQGCSADGTSRTVNFQVAREGPPPDLLEWDFGDGSPRESQTGQAAEAGTASHPYSPSDYMVTVIARREGCDEVSAHKVINVASCPRPHPACPKVVLDSPTYDECDGKMREVHARAQVYPGRQLVSARLELQREGHAPILLATKDDQQAAFTLEGHHKVLPGTYNVVVVVTRPSGCAGASRWLTVPACEPASTTTPGANPGGTPAPGTDPGGTPAPQPGSEQTDDDQGDAGLPTIGLPNIPVCYIHLVIALVLMFFGALFLAVGICIASSLYTWAGGWWWLIGVGIAVFGLFLLAVGNLMLAAWFALCGSCEKNCDLLLGLIELLTVATICSFLIAGLAAILVTYGISYFCWAGWLLDVADFGLMLAIANWYAGFVGCRKWSSWVPEFARLRVPSFMQAACNPPRSLSPPGKPTIPIKIPDIRPQVDVIRIHGPGPRS